MQTGSFGTRAVVTLYKVAVLRQRIVQSLLHHFLLRDMLFRVLATGT